MRAQRQQTNKIAGFLPRQHLGHPIIHVLAQLLLGGFAGNYGLEKGASVQEQVQEMAAKRGIDVRDEAAVAKMLEQEYAQINAAAQRKGVGTASTDAVLNVATMGLAGLGYWRCRGKRQAGCAGGKEFAPMRDMVLKQESLQDAMELLTQEMQQRAQGMDSDKWLDLLHRGCGWVLHRSQPSHDHGSLEFVAGRGEANDMHGFILICTD